MKNLKLFVLLFCFFNILSYSNVMAIDEANYEVVEKNSIYEIRKYSDRLAIETITDNQNNSFRKLFNYISGNNKTNEEIKMTTPVTRIEKEGNMTMQFYLPERFDVNNVPDPANSDVKIINTEGGYFAVLKYSGRSSEKNFIKHKEILQNKLNKNNVLIKSSSIMATYNSPFTLPPLRRNEVMFKIDF
jgi:hypothetical protein